MRHIVLSLQESSRLTEALLESFDIAALGAAFPPLFIVGARVAETRACAATWSQSVALELPFSTYHAGQTLWLRDTRIVGCGATVGCRVNIVWTLGAHGIVRGRCHDCWSERRDPLMTARSLLVESSRSQGRSWRFRDGWLRHGKETLNGRSVGRAESESWPRPRQIGEVAVQGSETMTENR